MNYNWKTLSLGGKLMTVATVVAIISIFLPWLDLVRFSYNGFQEFAVFLLFFYIYPVYKMMRNEAISLPIGIGSAVLAAAAAVGYMEWKTIPYEGIDLCFAGHGTYIFFFASILLLVGVMKYQPSEVGEQENPESAPDSTI